MPLPSCPLLFLIQHPLLLIILLRALATTEVKARRPRLVLGWVTTREDWRCNPGSVRRYGLESVTDRLYSRYRADTDAMNSTNPPSSSPPTQGSGGRCFCL